MDAHIVCSRLNIINDEIARLINDLYAIEVTNTVVHPMNYEELTTMAALRAEKIACSLRHLIYTTTQIKKKDFMNKVADVHNFKIEETSESVTITIPSLLPKRKSGYSSSEFLTDPLFHFLNEFSQTHAIRKYDDCIVCFEHIYDEKLSDNRIRDYDNIELKRILDVISTFFLVDDSGKYLDSYNTTLHGSSDCTRIIIMKKEAFSIWFSKHKSRLEGKNYVGV